MEDSSLSEASGEKIVCYSLCGCCLDDGDGILFDVIG